MTATATATATAPARRRRGRWFTDLPIAAKILGGGFEIRILKSDGRFLSWAVQP